VPTDLGTPIRGFEGSEPSNEVTRGAMGTRASVDAGWSMVKEEGLVLRTHAWRCTVPKLKTRHLSRRHFLGVSVGAVMAAGVGCGSEDEQGSASSGGQTGSGGTGPGGGPGSGGKGALGGSPGSGGTTSAAGKAAGGSSAGGTALGGVANGGKSGTGGAAATGGASATGGAATGGKLAGGSSATGGTATGGTSASGGTAGNPVTGGTSATGGSNTGGSNTGGQVMGGTSNAGAGGSGATGTPLVALVRNAEVAQSVQDAIAMVGGLPDLSGRTVVLKPNLLRDEPSPCTTNPEVVRGVIRAVKARNAQRIIIGDGSMNTSAITVMAGSSGIHAVVTAETGVEELDFTTVAYTLLTPTGATRWPTGFNVWDVLLDDGAGNRPFVINMPTCKHHGSAVWTLAMKNWYGIIPHGERAGTLVSGMPDNRSHVGSVLRGGLPELHLAVKEDFVVLDATKAQLTGGPSNGDASTQQSPGIVVATPDAVAAEATGLCILREYRSRIAAPADNIENVAIFNTDTTTLMGRALTLNNGWISNRQQYTYVAQGLGTDEAAILGRLDA
jgi:uncharacterized protein (DUF362 family)